jgi:hypothetical protein
LAEIHIDTHNGDIYNAHMQEGFEMEKRHLLFVTHRDADLTEGVSYAVELAKTMNEDIMLLFVQKRSGLIGKVEDLMTAVAFAEAGDRDTARWIASGNSREVKEVELDAVVSECFLKGIHLSVHMSELDAISGTRKFLKEHRSIDKVVLSPAITAAGNVSSREMDRLVRSVSRPIVTMTRNPAQLQREERRYERPCEAALTKTGAPEK